MFKQTPYAQAFLKKQAFVPYTQEAMNPPQDPSMQGQDPNAQGGPPPEQGGAPQIQTQPGPNGEPIDVETGFIVVDPQQGIEQDPLTGILYNKFQDQFMTPDGQPIPPEQAIQMIQQAQQQGAAAAPEQGAEQAPPPEGAPAEQMPPEGAPAPAQGAEPPMQEGAPAAPPMPQAAAGQSFDPSTGMMMDDATGLPVDPNTGMLIDPRTGQQINPQTGEVAAAGQSDNGMPFTDDPEIQKVMDKLIQQNEKNEKQIAALSRNVNSTRTDLQGLRREISEANDNSDVIQQRLENTVALLEQVLGSRVG